MSYATRVKHAFVDNEREALDMADFETKKGHYVKITYEKPQRIVMNDTTVFSTPEKWVLSIVMAIPVHP